MKIDKYTIGVGDRFGRQGKAQLQAVMEARKQGADVVPVWNKSFREHGIIGTSPADVRAEADTAVHELGWQKNYYVDADHINLDNVESFIDVSDFFTLDVAEAIGQPAFDEDVAAFVKDHEKYVGELAIPAIRQPMNLDGFLLQQIAEKYLGAVRQAGRIYRHIAARKGGGNFITEVSMDETDSPQTPLEMFFILAMIAREEIPAQTIAPKFTGRFNKGVDYVGDVGQFAKEFREDLAVIQFAVREFDLPDNLKLSVHSGSDKFSIYPPISQALKEFDAGIHVKTAGTTWLEELIGLAESEGSGLEIAKEVYVAAMDQFDALCGPYAMVIDIDKNRLPDPRTVRSWNGKTFADTLRHVQDCPEFNPNFRQLLHVGYKVAAQMGARYLQALSDNEAVIARNVIENILERHIRPIFLT